MYDNLLLKHLKNNKFKKIHSSIGSKIVIYHQQILDCLDVCTKQPVKHFYDILFQNLDLSSMPAFPIKGQKLFSAHSMLRAFILMKIERFHWLLNLSNISIIT